MNGAAFTVLLDRRAAGLLDLNQEGGVFLSAPALSCLKNANDGGGYRQGDVRLRALRFRPAV